jgi:SagB-type dehydrogenase family enzyme
MTGGRSHLRSSRDFLKRPRASQSSFESRLDLGDGGPVVAYAVRPYPSSGGSYELELYLAVDKCEGLACGFCHYDAGAHALVPIEVRANELDSLLMAPEFAMAATAPPQILITIVAVRPSVHGDRHEAQRMRYRNRQYRSVRENDGHCISRRGAGRSICARSRCETGRAHLTRLS